MGSVSFEGRSLFSKIIAVNNSAVCVLDTKTGAVHFSLLIQGFEFKKSLMQTHFNEKYMESDKFPNSEFKGQLINNNIVKYTTDGAYPAMVKGKLTIHGVTKDVTTNGKIIVKTGKISLNASFTIQVPDYNIKANMKDQVTISVDCNLEPLKK